MVFFQISEKELLDYRLTTVKCAFGNDQGELNDIIFLTL